MRGSKWDGHSSAIQHGGSAEATMVREQEQFLEVVDRDTAELRGGLAFSPKLSIWSSPPGPARDAVPAINVIAQVDVPHFDRSNVDGFAVQAQDTYHAAEETPRLLLINAEEIPTARVPTTTVESGFATSIATGEKLPRGADAVVMVEHAPVMRNKASCSSFARPPGAAISFAGTDMAGESWSCDRAPGSRARETGILGRHRRGHGRGGAPDAGWDHLDRRRDRCSRQPAAPRRSMTPTRR